MDRVIRQARERDVPELVRIYNQSIGKDRYANCDESAIDDAVFHERYGARVSEVELFVCVDRMGVCGWSGLRESSFLPEGSTVRELSLYVGDSHQRGVVGARLLAHVIRQAERSDVGAILAIVFRRNRASRRGLAAFGFRRAVRLREVARVDGRWEDMDWLVRDCARSRQGSQIQSRFEASTP